MSGVDKPIRKPGTSCPLRNKDVSKVCHKCDWYDILRGVNKAGEDVEIWGCALNRLAIVMQDVGAINAATCESMDRMRHEQSQERAQARVVMHALTRPRSPEAPALAGPAPGGPGLTGGVTEPLQLPDHTG